MPRINISRAKTISHFGQTHGVRVKFLTIRALKHLIKAPFPPFLYLYKGALHLLQKISTDFSGAFLLGLAMRISDSSFIGFLLV